jgi:hypothetical protein
MDPVSLEEEVEGSEEEEWDSAEDLGEGEEWVRATFFPRIRNLFGRCRRMRRKSI